MDNHPPGEAARFRRLLSEVEAAVYDEDRLAVLWRSVKEADLTEDRREDLLGRIQMYRRGCVIDGPAMSPEQPQRL